MARFPANLTRHPRTAAKLRPTGPTINRGKGNNNAATPWAFINPVQEKFGKLDWDLAASVLNTKAEKFLAEKINSLVQPWHKLGPGRPLLWLNPPFTTITPWAKKCAEECQLGARILLLVPASVGSNWYWDWVVPYADVYSVGRMVFDDCYDKHGELITTPYPKDLILCHYEWRGKDLRTGNEWASPGYGVSELSGLIRRWRWQDA